MFTAWWVVMAPAFLVLDLEKPKISRILLPFLMDWTSLALPASLVACGPGWLEGLLTMLRAVMDNNDSECQ